MFYPQEVTEIEMIVPEKDIVPVTKVLSGQGTFQLADSNYLSPDIKPGSTSVWSDKAQALAALERRFQNVMTTLGIDEKTPPIKDQTTDIDIDAVSKQLENIELDVKKVSDEIQTNNKQMEQYQNTIHQLEPVADIDLDLSLVHHSNFLYSVLGVIPLPNMERLETSLSQVPFILLPLRKDNHEAVVWLAGSRNNQDVLERATRSAYLNPLVLPSGFQGAPVDIIQSLKKSYQAAEKKNEELVSDIQALSKKYSKELFDMYWGLRSAKMLTDAVVRYGRLKHTFLVVGWVVTSKLQSTMRQIESVSKETIFETYPTKRPGNGRSVPSYISHPGVMQPFQMLVTTFGQPRYDELDPTAIIMVMFPFLFGVMFGDLGQGIVLALLGWLLVSKKVKALKGMASLGGVILACGIVASIFGILYGSFFGFEEVIHPLWMSPVKNILIILEIAIGGGVILLSLGYILGIVNAISARDWPKLFFEHSGIPGLTLYWSLLGIGATAFMPTFPVPQMVFIVLGAASFIVIAFSHIFINLFEGHRPLLEDNIFIYLIQVFFEMLEVVISYLSNTLSYVRVGAFAVAHGGLSAAIFILAEMAGVNTVGYWVAIFLGNVFIVGFEGLIVGIQTMRLSYYEFFSKFFTAGGMKYEPLSTRPVNE